MRPEFYDDDPLWHMPKPMRVEQANNRKLSDVYDFFSMTFVKPGEKQTPGHPIPAGAVNTLGEVPDSTWYTNRHTEAPDVDRRVGPWSRKFELSFQRVAVACGCSEDGRCHTRVHDQGCERPVVPTEVRHFDNFEQGTGADVMGSKIFYALGYNTPENYLVYFGPEQLLVDEKTEFVDYRGVTRKMRQSDIEGVLNRLPRDPEREIPWNRKFIPERQASRSVPLLRHSHG